MTNTNTNTIRIRDLDTGRIITRGIRSLTWACLLVREWRMEGIPCGWEEE